MLLHSLANVLCSPEKQSFIRGTQNIFEITQKRKKGNIFSHYIYIFFTIMSL